MVLDDETSKLTEAARLSGYVGVYTVASRALLLARVKKRRPEMPIIVLSTARETYNGGWIAMKICKILSVH